jgi:hypothetical protein
MRKSATLSCRGSHLANSGRTCAYCDAETNLTCEHIIPDNFHQSVGESISIVKTPSGDKAVFNAQEVRDVCANCNNGPLSVLDSYFGDLYGKYFSKIVHSGDRIRFHYDFELLLRLLLKITYNVARTRKWPVQIYRDCRRYILGKEKELPSGFRMFLQLLVPTSVSKTDLSVTPGTKEVTPIPWRTELYELTGFPGIAFASSTSIMSYRFFLLREDASVPVAVRRKSIARWLKENKGTKELTTKARVTIHASSVSVVDAVRNNSIFLDQLAKARKLKQQKASNSA